MSQVWTDHVKNDKLLQRVKEEKTSYVQYKEEC